MSSIKSTIKYLENLSDAIDNVPNVIRQTTETNKALILSINRDQMLQGRDNQGLLFTPNYLQDPYFKSAEQAKAYAAMKDSLLVTHNLRIQNPTQYPNKPRLTPNLIVTGPFQDSMFISVGQNNLSIGSTYIDASDINQKYGGKVFGISPEYRSFLWLEIYSKAIIESLNNAKNGL